MKKISWKSLIAVIMSLMLAAVIITRTDVDAAENGQEEVYYGDVDDNGVIEAKDVTALRRYLAGGWNVTVNMDKADVDFVIFILSRCKRYIRSGCRNNCRQLPME